LTVFDGSQDDESKLAKQFWNSVTLIPPMESTLVCKEINQRVRTRILNDGPTKRMFISSLNSIIFDFFVSEIFNGESENQRKKVDER
jgi:hypothetical protein